MTRVIRIFVVHAGQYELFCHLTFSTFIFEVFRSDEAITNSTGFRDKTSIERSRGHRVPCHVAAAGPRRERADGSRRRSAGEQPASRRRLGAAGEQAATGTTGE